MPTRKIFHRVVAIDRTIVRSRDILTWIILICSTTKITNRCPFEKKRLKMFFSKVFFLCWAFAIISPTTNGHFILARTVLCLHVKNQDG